MLDSGTTIAAGNPCKSSPAALLLALLLPVLVDDAVYVVHLFFLGHAVGVKSLGLQAGAKPGLALGA